MAKPEDLQPIAEKIRAARWEGKPLGRHAEGGMAKPEDLQPIAEKIRAAL
jgi:hypothetical protein